MLMAGSGFLSSLVAIRLEAGGARAPVVGAVAAAYFLGLAIGAVHAEPLIRRVGHIRAFAAAASLFSASALAYAIHQHAALWALLRLADGLCMAGLFVCLESWLNERAAPKARGTVLAAYMIALYAGQAIGQFLLATGAERPALPFVAGSILLSLAVIPVALTHISQPAPSDEPPLKVKALYAVSPLGIAGAVATGIMLGAFYGLGALFARRVGLGLAEIASFISTVIIGGVALQWPLGRLSDRFDRRGVITAAFLGTAIVAALLALPGLPRPALYALGALFGGLAFALYPMCVAHLNDHLRETERVAASGGLVLAYSGGAVIGPLAGSAAMRLAGPGGLFGFLAVCAAFVTLFALYRRQARLPVPAALKRPFRMLPRTTPAAAALDPLAGDSPERPTP